MTTRTLHGLFSLVLVACGAVSGCALEVADVDPGEDVGTAEEEIINGTVVQNDASGIVKLNAGNTCSGAMINGAWAITAKHCVDAGVLPSQVTVTLGTTGIKQGVAEIVLHPTLDVALVRLIAPFQVNGQAAHFYNPVYRGTTLSLDDRTLTCYGYGRNTFTGGTGTLRTADLVVEPYSPTEYKTLTNAAGQQLWSGDSGGPCTLTEGGFRYLTGVTSWCHYRSASQTVTACYQVSAEVYHDWVDEVIHPAIPATVTWGDPNVLYYEISDVKVNGGGNVYEGLRAGQPFTLSMNQFIKNPACPGCIDQILVGVAACGSDDPDACAGSPNMPATCAYNGSPGSAGLSRSAAMGLIAPSQPGLYFIRHHYGQAFSCNLGWWDIGGKPTAAANIAAIYVVQ